MMSDRRSRRQRSAAAQQDARNRQTRTLARRGADASFACSGTSESRTEAIAALRRLRMTGPEIAEVLGTACSTVSGILRIGLGKLSRLEPPEPPNRLAPAAAGEVGRHELVLGTEVDVEGGLGDARLRDDRVHADAADPVGVEETLGGLEDPYGGGRARDRGRGQCSGRSPGWL